MKTSTFTDGTVDIYKGRRDVKAGWQVILPCGKIVQGHSLNAKLAEKTARSSAHHHSGLTNPYPGTGALPIGYIQARNQLAIHQGYKNWLAYDADRKAKVAAHLLSCQIEIVQVEG